MKTFYHVTKLENYNNIKEVGLIPQVGELSSDCDEIVPRVYLFPTLDDMENALGNWLGEWYEENYGEDIELCSLKITLPDNFPISYDEEVPYECYSYSVIEPRYIDFLKEE